MTYGHPNPEPGVLYVLEKSYGLRLYTQNPGEHPVILVETPLRISGPTEAERAGAIEVVRRWNLVAKQQRVDMAEDVDGGRVRQWIAEGRIKAKPLTPRMSQIDSRELAKVKDRSKGGRPAKVQK